MTQLFDSYDKSYGDVVQSSIDFSGLPYSFFQSAKADLIRDLMGRRFGADAKPPALDVGCGTGAFHPFVRHLFGRFCGIDVSSNCIEQAKRSQHGVEYAVFDGKTLPHGDASFDFVSAICVMHHVVPAQRAAFMREMRRVVRPGGLVCVIEHNPFNPLTRLAVRRCEFDRDAVLLRAGETARLMLDAQLRSIRTRYLLLVPSASPFARGLERLFAALPFGAQYATYGEA